MQGEEPAKGNRDIAHVVVLKMLREKKTGKRERRRALQSKPCEKAVVKKHPEEARPLKGIGILQRTL